MIRVAIFNDSLTLRARLRTCLTQEEGFDIVLEAENGRAAASKIAEARAQLVLMDVIMPDVDGYAATRDIMDQHPVPIIIVTAALNPQDSAVIFRALAAGALYVTGPPAPGDALKQAAFLQLLRATAGAKPQRTQGPAAEPHHTRPGQAQRTELSVIAVATSAGGPQALTEILHRLPLSVLPPMLVVQHLSANFDRSFAAWLSSETGHQVQVARHGLLAEPGAVYIAPNGLHLQWDGGKLALSHEAPVGRFRPSATVLFQSVASEGTRALGIVLSGMGDDGAAGAESLHAAGGHVIVQCRDSAAIWGMPGEVVRRGAFDAELSTTRIAEEILSLSGIRS